MVGVGHTVFNGTKVEEFRARILGVIENVMGPQRNLILARLEGGPLADTGVIAGMSGSPVYVDGRLIGAVSYALGSFSKEPIAGITPIEEMTADTALDAARPAGARVHIEFPLTPDNLVAAVQKGAQLEPAVCQPARRRRARRRGRHSRGSAVRSARCCGPLPRRSSCPDSTPASETFSGGRSASRASCRRARTVGTRPGDMPFDGPLKPGDAIGVTFVNGDFLLGGTGTVTHIDGDRVYAFGHPMYNIGPTQFPMTRAYVYTVLPSLFSSTKLSTTGEVIGTLLQDRATAIAGRLGAGPRAHARQADPAARAGREPHVQLRRGPGSALRAAHDALGAAEHAGVLRAAVRHGDLYRRGLGHRPQPRDGVVQQPLLRRLALDERGHLRHRAACRHRHQRRRACGHRAARADHQVVGAAADRDDRARLDRRSASARGPHRAAQGAAAHLSRRGRAAHGAHSDSGQRQQHADHHGDRCRAAGPGRAARSQAPAAGPLACPS